MLLTETIKYRNREIPVTELKPNSDKQVWVLCPDCKKVRQVYWKVFLKAKSHKCHSCTNMAHSKDIEPGTKYGKLIVIDKRKSGYSVCQCDCGEITEIANYNLRTNHTKSCGCLKLDSFRNAKPCIGKKHGNWKGGITPENVSIRKSVQYKVWREMVFARDNYTCQDCGQVGYELRAHHVYNFANNKDKRLDVHLVIIQLVLVARWFMLIRKAGL